MNKHWCTRGSTAPKSQSIPVGIGKHNLWGDSPDRIISLALATMKSVDDNANVQSSPSLCQSDVTLVDPEVSHSVRRFVTQISEFLMSNLPVWVTGSDLAGVPACAYYRNGVLFAIAGALLRLVTSLEWRPALTRAGTFLGFRSQ